MRGYIHHVQWSVADVGVSVAKLRREYGMQMVAIREVGDQIEAVMNSGSVTFLVSPSSDQTVEGEEGEGASYPLLSSGRPNIDTVFNICLAVDNVTEAWERMVKGEARSLINPRIILDKEGEVEMAAVTSPCDNVIHSLVDIDKYTGVFLPGFSAFEDTEVRSGAGDLLTSIDHVTYVCNPGDTERILAWYRECCDMQRFLITEDEDPEAGLEVPDVGMRLSVGEWVTEWLCREQGVQGDTFKLVLAEPLEGNKESHVNSFLKEHNGPGIQHIGLGTEDIVSTVSILSEAGAKFRKPPPTYYRLEDKRADILSIGASPEEFARLGILIDKEPTEPAREDTESQDDTTITKSTFLLQLFSFPLFSEDTFFLEIIQRQNSRGFGGGNIKALAESILELQKQLDRFKAALQQSSKPLLKTMSHQEFSSMYGEKKRDLLKKSKTCFDIFQRDFKNMYI